ncbi:hypothetical protein EAS64_33700 [Trebonia kvetii]|uniref:Lipoprotein n=1 Tax=Trebonia kvetii TaxID=2480626 RepID=A0A6P2BSN3_9ACTN|nr:hypothetical protein [Trebonia kvetii]TVZ01236.1 hypothetical protein EAS64_33700 [Trebonia kvetii]
MNKIIGLSAAALITAGALAGCSGIGTQDANQAESAAQRADASSLEQSQPLPHFNYSQIRATIIDAETIEANGTQTTSFFFQMGSRDPVFSCPSLGEPVSNTASLSNPYQAVTADAQGNGFTGAAVIGQMDPNGIYAPSSSSGTYVICVAANGSKYMQYWEGDVMTVTAGAVWDATAHTLKVIGAPTAAIHTAAK